MQMLDLEFIEQLRKERGLSAIRVAKHLGIGDTTYYNKITGYRRFTVNEFIKLGQLYGVELEKFVIKRKVDE